MPTRASRRMSCAVATDSGCITQWDQPTNATRPVWPDARYLATLSEEDKKARLMCIRFVDEEGRVQKQENYLWNENALVGLDKNEVRLFKR